MMHGAPAQPRLTAARAALLVLASLAAFAALWFIVSTEHVGSDARHGETACVDSSSTPRRRSPFVVPHDVEQPIWDAATHKLKQEARVRELLTEGDTRVGWEVQHYYHEAANRQPVLGEEWRADTRARIRGRKLISYTDDQHLYAFLDEFGAAMVAGKRVVIPGSERPHYELLLLEQGKAHSVRTLDYREWNSDILGLTIQHVDKYWRAPTLFDFALSYSNFEHDGLGRYGDPLDPQGDIKAMAEIRSMLVAGGHLALAVPVGPDCISMNGHRRYGNLRLPRMFRGWEVVKIFEPVVRKPAPVKECQVLVQPCIDPVCKWEPQALFVLRRADDPLFDPTASLVRWMLAIFPEYLSWKW